MFDYVYIIGAGLIVVLLVWVVMIELRLKKLFRGKKGADVEEIISSINNDLKNSNKSREEIEKYLKNVETRLRKSVSKVSTVRFNPFENSGSNQSFVLAFLDEEGNGAVISSLYSREGVRVYAKPIKNYESEYALSKEEEQAINDSR